MVTHILQCHCYVTFSYEFMHNHMLLTLNLIELLNITQYLNV